jgi:transcriptional regulator with XRE-family HTH domain
MSETGKPFTSLGKHLKYLREQHKQSLAEVSGAVEIDERTLERIEEGTLRPDEDILLLLITHFEMPDQEAVQLWEMAGYDGELPDQIQPVEVSATKQAVVVLAMDVRTVYSDGLEIIANPAGLTLNFTQTASATKSNSVARVGMSLEQAEQVLGQLQSEVLKLKYSGKNKTLPPSTQK